MDHLHRTEQFSDKIIRKLVINLPFRHKRFKSQTLLYNDYTPPIKLTNNNNVSTKFKHPYKNC